MKPQAQSVPLWYMLHSLSQSGQSHWEGGVAPTKGTVGSMSRLLGGSALQDAGGAGHQRSPPHSPTYRPFIGVAGITQGI